MEVRLRKRKTGESISSLHQDIKRLMALAFPDLPSTTRDVIGCDYFIDSLDDRDFALKVRERNPSSLDDALRIALQLEAWIKDASRQTVAVEDPTLKNAARRRDVRVVTSNNSDSSEITALKQQIETLTKQMSDLVLK